MTLPSLRTTFSALVLLLSSSSVLAAGADTILINAKAYTLDQAKPWAEAVAITGNTITYVGDNAGALTLSDSNTRTIDLKGKMLLPGFIDTHMHPLDGGAYAKALSLDTFATTDDWVAAIKEFAEANKDAELIFGYGFLSTTFGPAGPTREMIDAVVADRPVLIMDEGFHGAWANTAALKRLGITRDTADPVPGFSYYKRDASGEPTGYLLEATAGMAMESLSVITDDVIVDGTSYVIDTLNSYGVTSIFDASSDYERTRALALLSRIEDAGNMTVRIVGAYRAPGPEAVAQAIPTALAWRDSVKGEFFQYPVIKFMLDGTVEGRTAAMFEDYQGEPGNRGELVYSSEDTGRLVVAAAENNLDVHIHALGERAVFEGLNAVELARNAYPASTSRYTLCHVQVITDADLPRFAKLNVIAQSTPLWASFDTYGEEFVSADQFSRFWRFKSLADAGAKLTWGSDFPASGAGMLGMSPIYQMEVGHTRQWAGEPTAPIQPRKSERLSIAALIRGYTLDAAYQLHMEDQIGSLEVGKLADMVVLKKNLFEVGTYQIHKIGVALTVMDGKVVYQAEE